MLNPQLKEFDPAIHGKLARLSDICSKIEDNSNPHEIDEFTNFLQFASNSSNIFLHQIARIDSVPTHTLLQARQQGETPTILDRLRSAPTETSVTISQKHKSFSDINRCVQDVTKFRQEVKEFAKVPLTAGLFDGSKIVNRPTMAEEKELSRIRLEEIDEDEEGENPYVNPDPVDEEKDLITPEFLQAEIEKEDELMRISLDESEMLVRAKSVFKRTDCRPSPDEISEKGDCDQSTLSDVAEGGLDLSFPSPR